MTIELRDAADGASWNLTGINPYGVSYSVTDHRGSYRETLAAYAFREHLSTSPTIPLLIQHGGRYSPVLAATGRSGTMTLSERSTGLQVAATLSKSDPDAVGAVSKIERGLLDRLSVGMAVSHDGESWTEDRAHRTVNRARLGELSLVLSPANPGATISARTEMLEGYELRDLGAIVTGASELRRAFTEAERKALGAQGKAISYGGRYHFPTPDREAFDDAVSLVHQAPANQQDAVRAYLRRRAKEEGWPLPPSLRAAVDDLMLERMRLQHSRDRDFEFDKLVRQPRGGEDRSPASDWLRERFRVRGCPE